MALAITTPSPLERAPTARRIVLKASRPALTDLRFKGDAWIVDRGTHASVCLGDYPLGHVAVLALDIPSLNRTFGQVRTGQARRNIARRVV